MSLVTLLARRVGESPSGSRLMSSMCILCPVSRSVYLYFVRLVLIIAIALNLFTNSLLKIANSR